MLDQMMKSLAVTLGVGDFIASNNGSYDIEVDQMLLNIRQQSSWVLCGFLQKSVSLSQMWCGVVWCVSCNDLSLCEHLPFITVQFLNQWHILSFSFTMKNQCALTNLFPTVEQCCIGSTIPTLLLECKKNVTNNAKSTVCFHL